MTIHDAMTIFTACDLSKDDCHDCPLFEQVHFRDQDGGAVYMSACELLGHTKDTLAPIPLPDQKAPNVQG